MKTDDGRNKGNISFYCRALEVSRQAFYDYIVRKDNPWKYEELADEMLKIHNEDEYNDCYGRERMYMALMQKKRAGDISIDIPCESTVRKVMDEIGLIHKPRKVYVSAIFDCFDLMPLGLAIEDNMRASLCCHTLENAKKSYPDINGCIIHSDRGSQYTSTEYRAAIQKYGIIQSMNSAGGRCHDNARCESMWARMKEELFYSRNDKSENYTVAELKTKIWRYYMSYWANRRICTANGGLPPAVKRKLYYDVIKIAA